MNDKPLIRIESICLVHKEEMDSRTQGIFVEAEVSYPITVFREEGQIYHQEHRRIDTLRSSGLWGIATDTSFAETVRIEGEELISLKNHLSVFGVDVSNFERVKIQMRSE